MLWSSRTPWVIPPYLLLNSEREPYGRFTTKIGRSLAENAHVDARAPTPKAFIHKRLDLIEQPNTQLQTVRDEESRDPEMESRSAQYEMAFRMQSSVPELTDLGLAASPGPVPSMRLKLWRRGLQDAELFFIARDKTPDAAEQLIRQMMPVALAAARGPRAWPTDPARWIEFRRELLRLASQ